MTRSLYLATDGVLVYILRGPSRSDIDKYAGRQGLTVLTCTECWLELLVQRGAVVTDTQYRPEEFTIYADFLAPPA